MKKLMEYKIISGGCVVETRRSWMPVRKAGEPRPTRGVRKAGSSSEAKIKANETESARKLARKINSTVKAGDLWVSLRYDDQHLPESWEAACEHMEKWMRILRREFKKLHGRLPYAFWATANWSPRRKAPARLHQHIVIEAEAYDLLPQLWTFGSIGIELLDGRADHSSLAFYMVDNVHGVRVKQKWHASRNVKGPVYTDPVPVDDPEDVQPEKGAVISEHQVTIDEEGHVVGSYLRCILPAPVKIRGGQIVIPGRRRR